MLREVDYMSKIKYHQNGLGWEYGEDHTLTDNWDPDLDYGNEYVKVYFRIKTPSFESMNGFFNSNEDRDKWRAEVNSVIESLGIMEDSGWKVKQEKLQCAYLFAHPQDISGVVRKNDVKKIAETIDRMELSSIRWVDLYETVYVISDKEYENYLDGKKDEIRKLIFEYAATKRTNNFHSALDIAVRIAEAIKLHRLGRGDEFNYYNGQTVKYVEDTINKMIEEGYLKHFEQNGYNYIRSLNKTEQRKLKLYME
jgi:hypothetical protein